MGRVTYRSCRGGGYCRNEASYELVNRRFPSLKLGVGKRYNSDTRTLIASRSGYPHTHQLWRFEKVGSYYRIYNAENIKDRITTFSLKKGRDVRAYDGSKGKPTVDYRDQLWELIKVG